MDRKKRAPPGRHGVCVVGWERCEGGQPWAWAAHPSEACVANQQARHTPASVRNCPPAPTTCTVPQCPIWPRSFGLVGKRLGCHCYLHKNDPSALSGSSTDLDSPSQAPEKQQPPRPLPPRSFSAFPFRACTPSPAAAEVLLLLLPLPSIFVSACPRLAQQSPYLTLAAAERP